MITLHPLIHGDFPNKLTRKIYAEQCLALYSRWRTQQTHACFQLGLSAVQTSEPTCKTQGNTLLVLLLYVSYWDNCIRIRIVLWKKCIVAGLLLNTFKKKYCMHLQNVQTDTTSILFTLVLLIICTTELHMYFIYP